MLVCSDEIDEDELKSINLDADYILILKKNIIGSFFWLFLSFKCRDPPYQFEFLFQVDRRKEYGRIAKKK